MPDEHGVDDALPIEGGKKALAAANRVKGGILAPSSSVLSKRSGEPMFADILIRNDKRIREFFEQCPGAAEACYTLMRALADYAERCGLRPGEIGVTPARTSEQGEFRIGFRRTSDL